MRVVLIASSLAVLLFSFLFYWDENVTAEWVRWQNRYAAFLAETSSQRKAGWTFRVRQRQEFLPHLGRVDRCVSCHVGVENPAMKGRPQPLALHPGDLLDLHDLGQIGCTVCHDGQGRATSVKQAHALDHGVFFEKPILQAPMIEANCYRCHVAPLKRTPHYARGKRIFDTHGCRGCHRVNGDGGTQGPDLSRIGDASPHVKHASPQNQDRLAARFRGNENVAYIYEAVRYPAAQPKNTLMFNLGFTDDEAIALTVYLKSLTEPVPGASIIPRRTAKKPESLVERGKRLYLRYCVACHGPGASGGRKNRNAIKESIPELRLLTEKLMLYEPKDVKTFVRALREHGDLPKDGSSLDLPRPRVTRAQLKAIRGVIRNGNPSGKLDPKGPSPLNMPSWNRILDKGEITALIAYFVSEYPWDD
ncbi:MAG: cytochrome c [Deltaproteobacteria bacterium]|nr:cytochrome c [Deltaproteobacteria bacterium]